MTVLSLIFYLEDLGSFGSEDLQLLTANLWKTLSYIYIMENNVAIPLVTRVNSENISINSTSTESAGSGGMFLWYWEETSFRSTYRNKRDRAVN